MTLKATGHRSKKGTIGFLELKNTDLDTKIAILSDLVQKLWSETYFYKMVDNVMCSHMSHIQTLKILKNSIKGFPEANLC